MPGGGAGGVPVDSSWYSEHELGAPGLLHAPRGADMSVLGPAPPARLAGHHPSHHHASHFLVPPERAWRYAAFDIERADEEGSSPAAATTGTGTGTGEAALDAGRGELVDDLIAQADALRSAPLPGWHSRPPRPRWDAPKLQVLPNESSYRDKKRLANPRKLGPAYWEPEHTGDVRDGDEAGGYHGGGGGGGATGSGYDGVRAHAPSARLDSLDVSELTPRAPTQPPPWAASSPNSSRRVQNGRRVDAAKTTVRNT